MNWTLHFETPYIPTEYLNQKMKAHSWTFFHDWQKLHKYDMMIKIMNILELHISDFQLFHLFTLCREYSLQPTVTIKNIIFLNPCLQSDFNWELCMINRFRKTDMSPVVQGCALDEDEKSSVWPHKYQEGCSFLPNNHSLVIYESRLSPLLFNLKQYEVNSN